MDTGLSQQAIEILRMIYQKTQQGHVVSLTKESIGNGLQIAIDNSHNHATWMPLRGDNEDENLKIIINGLYDKLVHGNDAGWFEPASEQS